MKTKNTCFASDSLIKESYSNQPRILTRNGIHYVEFYYEGDRIRKSLETSDPDEAKRIAKVAAAEEFERRMSLKFPLISVLYDKYLSNTLKRRRQAAPTTKKKNVNCMERILRFYGIDSAQQDIRQLAKKTESGVPICDDWVHKHGPNTMRMARSLFSKEWIKFYKFQRIDTSWFANWISLSLEAPVVEPYYADNREEELVQKKCERLKKYDPEIYKAYALAYGLGLRSSEILRAKYSDFFRSGDHCLIRIHQPKSGGQFQDRPCDPFWWNEIMSMRGSEEFVISCPKDRIIREFPQFLRHECGVQGNKPVHRLRKMAGNRIMIDNGNSIYAASKCLGHKSIDLTSRIYVGLPVIRASRKET